jgi:hypothetical protein
VQREGTEEEEERVGSDCVEEIFAMMAQYPQIPIGMDLTSEQMSPSTTGTAAPARGLGLCTTVLPPELPLQCSHLEAPTALPLPRYALYFFLIVAGISFRKRGRPRFRFCVPSYGLLLLRGHTAHTTHPLY